MKKTAKKSKKQEPNKISISLRIAPNIVKAYKAEAKKQGIGYQTLMQLKIKEAMDNGGFTKRLETLEQNFSAATRAMLEDSFGAWKPVIDGSKVEKKKLKK